jgi:hypothetical protein
MEMATVSFESSERLVVQVGARVLFRCPIDLTDLGFREPLDAFLVRHGGVESTVRYMRKVLCDNTAQMMGLRMRPTERAPYC